MAKLFVAHQRFYNVSETLNYVQIVCRTPTFLQRFWNVNATPFNIFIIVLVNSIKQTTCIKQACHHFPKKGKCTVIYLH